MSHQTQIQIRVNQPKISFFSENTSYRHKGVRLTKKWITDTIVHEGKTPGELSIIFCNDDTLYEMNVKYLDHDTLTDIITFNYNDGNIVSGDIFISIDRVKENSLSYSRSFTEELSRVIIHGVLHLCGYNDKSPTEEKQMRKKEDQYLAIKPG